MIHKACPVMLRNNSGKTEILAFVHECGDCQIVKGTVESGEDVAAACEREFFEESGVLASSVRFLGEWESGYEGKTWGFYLMHSEEPLKERWRHITNDDGGRVFEFFWHPLDKAPEGNWHPVFVRAIEFIKNASGAWRCAVDNSYGTDLPGKSPDKSCP